MSIAATARAAVQNLTLIAAADRLEDLRSLAYEYDDVGLAVTDVSTDLSGATRSSGGAGLSAGGSVDTGLSGYVDHLDRSGRWLGNSVNPPADAAFTRRWSIKPLPSNSHVLVLQVVVVPAAADGGGTGEGVPGAARLFTLRARTRR